jgi:hypothetical protein
MAMTGTLAVVFVVAATPPALADVLPITLTPATQTVEYGQPWSVQASVPSAAWCEAVPCSNVTVTFTSGSITRQFPNVGIYAQQFSFGDYYLMPQTDLGVGTHAINLSFPDDDGTVTTGATPGKLTITAAPISSTTTIAADPNNGANAIVTAQLSGDYIEQLPNCDCEAAGIYPLPAGTWNLTVTNSKGTVVLSKQQQQPAGGNPFFVSYWSSVPAGESFTADTTFTVATASSANFALTDHKFSWTSAKVTGTTGTGAGTGRTKPTVLAATTSFAPPLWLLLLTLLVAAGLVALNVVLLVRRGVASRPTTAAAETVQ